jgi:hypothetical protein
MSCCPPRWCCLAIDEPDGYRLLQELSPGKTFLCCDVSENVVVLKRLEEDCLHRRQLHPSIRDRLAHVRELAHPRIATLRTVERWGGFPCVVWIYLDGETWDDAAIASDEQLLILISALAATVDILHENGIVHGDLHGRNVIVRAGSQVWLTHVSPYLYADHQVDIAATAELIRGKIPTDLSDRLTPMTEKLESGEISLREFSHLVLALDENPDELESPAPEAKTGYRVSSIVMAIALAGFAVVLWLTIQKFESKSVAHGATTFPSLRH